MRTLDIRAFRPNVTAGLFPMNNGNFIISFISLSFCDEANFIYPTYNNDFRIMAFK